YLQLFCYFMQPTPTNIRQMLLYAIKHYVPGHHRRITVSPPESHPVVGIYHPDAPALFQSFDEYLAWYNMRGNPKHQIPNPKRLGFRDSDFGFPSKGAFDPEQAIGFLLLRPQLISGAHRHYDALIRACEAEGLSVLPIISTLMDNRQAAQSFFVDAATGQPRVSQIVSLTGFSFVGGPGRNDSAAAVAWLAALKRPLRTVVSMDMQTIEQWSSSRIGLNPVQTTMQIAIPEIDGATEPLVFAGVPSGHDQPEPIPERTERIARRLSRWNRLQRLPRAAVRLGFVIYCFPPNKGNVGTAADLDVFASLWEILRRLQAEGYTVQAPESPDQLRHLVLGDDHAALGQVAYRLPADEYWRLCPYVEEIEAEWGPAPGSINTHGSDILIYGAQLGHVFIGIQPTFGYEGDPTRLLLAESGAPHHAFMGFYCYLNHIFRADALVHVGTHGALEFMPGKQVGLSDRCWPDRLIGDFPNIYLYSVNNPSEGTIAKRRSYAELISYLTPPMENAGLYKELASLKELIMAYRQSPDRHQREQLYGLIEQQARALHLEND
ncbi:MAG: cobaltochelatase subunit CobN, partial [Acidobacteriota bacterium]|nr:cobaltochelatase subunit CobN [Acidobacteriota bacterium]